MSIDLSGGDFAGDLSEDLIPRLRSYARKGQSLHFLRTDSHEASTKAQLLEILSGRPVDFLFIDGDHTYDGVKTDFQMYAPLVAKEGLIGFHDVVDHPGVPSCEVDRFWAEVKARWPHHEYLEPTDGPKSEEWGGIGVLEWPGNAPLNAV